MSLKGDGTEDDPMFTTKGINCASCAKGVQNMLGFRADHVSWQNFPFKDAGARMQKAGQGFSKVYNQSTYDQSYYNNGMNVARSSTEGGFNSDAISEGRYKHQGMQRNNSAAVGNAAGRRQRPMTAKVKNSGLR